MVSPLWLSNKTAFFKRVMQGMPILRHGGGRKVLWQKSLQEKTAQLNQVTQVHFLKDFSELLIHYTFLLACLEQLNFLKSYCISLCMSLFERVSDLNVGK